MLQYNPFVKNSLVKRNRFTRINGTSVSPVAVNVWQTVILPGALPNKTIIVLAYFAIAGPIANIAVREVGSTVSVLPYLRGSASIILIAQTNALGQIDILCSTAGGQFTLQGFLN